MGEHAGSHASTVPRDRFVWRRRIAGTIKFVDPKTDLITLSDGNTFVLSEGVEAETLKAGEKVKVTYSTAVGKLTASKVQVVK